MRIVVTMVIMMTNTMTIMTVKTVLPVLDDFSELEKGACVALVTMMAMAMLMPMLMAVVMTMLRVGNMPSHSRLALS